MTQQLSAVMLVREHLEGLSIDSHLVERAATTVQGYESFKASDVVAGSLVWLALKGGVDALSLAVDVLDEHLPAFRALLEEERRESLNDMLRALRT